MISVTPAQIAELERLLKRVRPKEFSAIGDSAMSEDGFLSFLDINQDVYDACDSPQCDCRDEASHSRRAWGELLAAAINNLPALLQAAKDAARYREALEDIVYHNPCDERCESRDDYGRDMGGYCGCSYRRAAKALETKE